jgi:hypothetical protein
LQAVTRVKLEQASKVTMWMPTRLKNGEGRAGREETNKHLSRSTGVVSTACREGRSGSVGESRDWRKSRLQTSPERAAASLGVGEGHMTDEAG